MWGLFLPTVCVASGLWMGKQIMKCHRYHTWFPHVQLLVCRGGGLPALTSPLLAPVLLRRAGNKTEPQKMDVQRHSETDTGLDSPRGTTGELQFRSAVRELFVKAKANFPAALASADLPMVENLLSPSFPCQAF